MDQHPIVLAFRTRLASSGYTDISICRLCRVNDQQIYRVFAVETLAGIPVIRDMDFSEMYSWR